MPTSCKGGVQLSARAQADKRGGCHRRQRAWHIVAGPVPLLVGSHASRSPGRVEVRGWKSIAQAAASAPTGGFVIPPTSEPRAHAGLAPSPPPCSLSRPRRLNIYASPPPP